MIKDDDSHTPKAFFLGGLLLRCAAVHRAVRDPVVRDHVRAATFAQVVRAPARERSADMEAIGA